MKSQPQHQPEKKKLKYRYHCDSCSGRATYAAAPYKFGSLVCEACGMTQPYKAENWLEVTNEEELDKINS